MRRVLGFAMVSKPQNLITLTERIDMSTESKLLGLGITAKPNNLIVAHQILGFEDNLGFASYWVLKPSQNQITE